MKHRWRKADPHQVGTRALAPVPCAGSGSSPVPVGLLAAPVMERCAGRAGRCWGVSVGPHGPVGCGAMWGLREGSLDGGHDALQFGVGVHEAVAVLEGGEVGGWGGGRWVWVESGGVWGWSGRKWRVWVEKSTFWGCLDGKWLLGGGAGQWEGLCHHHAPSWSAPGGCPPSPRTIPSPPACPGRAAGHTVVTSSPPRPLPPPHRPRSPSPALRGSASPAPPAAVRTARRGHAVTARVGRFGGAERGGIGLTLGL